MQKFVLEDVLKKINAFSGRYTISINIPSHFIASKHYMDQLYDEIKHKTKFPEALDIEIVERNEITELETAGENLRKLKSLGVKISLDDFGTGYSSLTYLRVFPVDCIKTDPSFITMLESGPRERLIMETLIKLCHELDCVLVVEGIEEKHAADSLSKMGVDYFQGYYFGKPKPIAKYVEEYQLDYLSS